MPTYDYKCLVCSSIKEVFHSIREMTEPSEETKREITCCDKAMVRTWIEAPAIKTPTRNRFLNEDRKKRNHNHFKSQVLPSISDSDSKRHHLNKLGYKN